MTIRLAVVCVTAGLWACGSASPGRDGGSGDAGFVADAGGSADAGGTGGDAGTQTLKTFSMGCCSFATLAIDSAGRVWAATDVIQPSGNVQLYRFDPATQTPTGFEISGTSGARVISGGLSIDATGNIWLVTGSYPGVSSATAVSLIQVSPTGTVLKRIHNVDTSPALACYQNPCANYPFSGPSSGPTSAAVDPSGNIWVTDRYTGVMGFFLTQLTPAGTLGTYAHVTTPAYTPFVDAIVIDRNGSLWVIDEQDNLLVKLTPGSAAQSMALPANLKLAGLHLAFDKQGTPWIAVTGTGPTPGELLKMSPTGAVAATYPIPNAGSADGIAVDNANTLWVNDNTNLKLRAVSTAGVFLAEYAMPRGASTNKPTPLGIDPAGNVWYGGTDVTNGTGVLTELPGGAVGPQFFPYSGPQYPY